ncbi:unnamed protein product [Arabis nemorensis]|uniref:Uncharacterized protein n=1 Tax=Arabis nemorensis TaxID=586526 RepID=A0A565BJD9_9BRAS|nr:unnamed protein product [Arabis nemorensis]
MHGNCGLLQGALRKTIAVFVYIFAEMRDSVWDFLEQYDLPVVVGSTVGKSDQSSQRAYSDPCEKWELVVASLQHFHMIGLHMTVRYDSLPRIQRSSIKIMNILRCSRLVGLVTMLIKINAANSLIEDYADCLDLRMEEGEAVENNSCDDLEVLIMPLSEGILETLENLPNPKLYFLLFEFGFQHLDTIGVASLPKRSGSQALRISSLHQRAWLLKLLAIALHTGSGSSSAHIEACQSILSHLFGLEVTEAGNESFSLNLFLPLPQIVSSLKYDTLVRLENVCIEFTGLNMTFNFRWRTSLGTASVSGCIYYYSERGDRMVDLYSFINKLWQLNEVKETIQQLLKWGRKYNRSLEEQALLSFIC